MDEQEKKDLEQEKNAMSKEEVKQEQDKETTQELIDKFDKLCEEYSCEDIDTNMLKKGLIEVVDNWS